MAGNSDGAGRGNKTGKRVSKRMPKERLDIVDQMLRKCLSHSAICAVLGRQWDITPRQVQNYMRKVYERWDADAKATLVDRVHLRRGQLEGVLEAAMAQQPPDLRAAVAALDRLCRVDGAYEPVRVAVSGSVDYRNMTSDEKRKELERLISVYAPSSKGNGAAHDHEPN